MIYSGFADEAGDAIDTQIRATQELGWTNIEARNIDKVNLTDIPDQLFDEVCEKLVASGLTIDCFGSAVANWGKDPRNEDDYQSSLASLKRAIPRMQRLGTKMIRGMSFAIVKDEAPDGPVLEKMIFRKLKTLVKVCEDGGVIYLHENCQNYGGLSYRHTLRLLEEIHSPNFALVFDTGNPVGSDNHIGEPPYQKQSTWEFYSQVKAYIRRVHIKDNVFLKETGATFPELRHTFPGEGNGEVRKVVADLLLNGFQGTLSIEPHLGAVYHDASKTSADEIRYANYVEYGRRLMKLVAEGG